MNKLPKIKWLPIDKITGSDTYLFFGKINPGTPHECYGSFYAVWMDDERHNLKDTDGDNLHHEPTHFLQIEYIRTPTL